MLLGRWGMRFHEVPNKEFSRVVSLAPLMDQYVILNLLSSRAPMLMPNLHKSDTCADRHEWHRRVVLMINCHTVVLANIATYLK